jgi:hypothetical protein
LQDDEEQGGGGELEVEGGALLCEGLLLVLDDGGRILPLDDEGRTLVLDEGRTLALDDGGRTLALDDGGRTLALDDGGRTLALDDGRGTLDSELENEGTILGIELAVCGVPFIFATSKICRGVTRGRLEEPEGVFPIFLYLSRRAFLYDHQSKALIRLQTAAHKTLANYTTFNLLSQIPLCAFNKARVKHDKKISRMAQYKTH